MKFLNITRLLGIQAKQDAVDQQAGTLRQADGVVCWPNGALSFALPWRNIWAIGDIDKACEDALAAVVDEDEEPLYTSGTHVVLITTNSAKVLVFYSFEHGVRGIFPWVPLGADINPDDTPTFSTPEEDFAHDLDEEANWFASPIGHALWIGNGKDANLYWDGTTLRLLGASVPVSGKYSRAKAKFPPCTSFVIGEQSVVYGAGNADEPLKVWLTETPAASEEYLEGVFSLETSFVKLLHQRGTAITGLSTWASYVVAHTNHGASALFGFKRTNEGWLCQQRHSATGAGAANPYCARGLNGIGTMWLGTDGEIYKDESSRTGLEDKLSARDFEIATRNAADFWNRGLDIWNNARPPVLAYDPRQGMAWVFGYNTRTQNGSMWAYNEGLGQITGPYHAPNLVRIVDCGPTKTYTLLGITTTGRLLAFRPNDLDEPAMGTVDWSNSATVQPMPFPPFVIGGGGNAPGLGYVKINTKTGAVNLRVPARVGHETVPIALTSPGGDVKRASDSIGDGDHFLESELAVVEFPTLDLKSVGKEKVLQQVILSWAPQSTAYVGVFAQNEKGHSCWRWAGGAFGKERQVVHLNLLGVRFRIRLLVVTRSFGRAALRDVVIGFLGKGVP